jgi:hypothetical protein
MFALPVTDAESNPISITSITGASGNVTVSNSGLNVTVTPNSNTYAGTETLTVTITDGTTPRTATFTVNVGSTAQITKYNMLSPFMGRPIQNAGGGTSAHAGTLTIGTNGTMISSAAQPNGEFYGGVTGSGTWTMNSSGEVTVNVGGTTGFYTTYVVSTTNNGTRLLLSKTNNGSQTYEFELVII